MHDVVVEMRDGRRFVGPLYMWRPAEGWFSIPADESAPDKIWLRDVAKAKKYDVRIAPGVVVELDLLQCAREDGWVDEQSP